MTRTEPKLPWGFLALNASVPFFDEINGYGGSYGSDFILTVDWLMGLSRRERQGEKRLP